MLSLYVIKLEDFGKPKYFAKPRSVDELTKAKIYTKLRTARSEATKLSKSSSYTNIQIYELKVTSETKLEGESSRQKIAILKSLERKERSYSQKISRMAVGSIGYYQRELEKIRKQINEIRGLGNW